MTLQLPPRSIIGCDDRTAQFVHDQLTSVIAGHAQATTTYRFYEEVDLWLGPWGQEGYPIAYGKFYNIAFTTNEKLMADPDARGWVWRTAILLQEALRDYIIDRIRDCTLPIAEAELRQAAFDSHPAAYDRAGLARLALVAPELIPIIVTIPGPEFLPSSENFSPAIRQVLVTVARVSPQIAGNILGALAGPALSRELAATRTAIERGELDYIPVLDQIISQLNVRQLPGEEFASAVRAVTQAAQIRRERVNRNTITLLKQSPAVRARVESAFPNLLRP